MTGDAAAVEAKGWHSERISPSYLRHWPSLFHFVRPEALAAAEAVFGHADYRRVIAVETSSYGMSVGRGASTAVIPKRVQ